MEKPRFPHRFHWPLLCSRRFHWYLLFLGLIVVFWGSPLVMDTGWVQASSPVKVFVNGQRLEFDVPPVIRAGRVLVPFRRLFEAVGAEVEWQAETRSVRAVRGSTRIELRIGVNAALVNGQLVTLDVAPEIVNGRTLVPLRFVGESLGATVLWDPQTYSVAVNLEGSATLSPSNFGLEGANSVSSQRFSQAVSRWVAVATIYTFDQAGNALGQGSGFVISPSGILVTNLHVIEGAASAEAVFGESLTTNPKKVKVVGLKALDRTHDLALLKLEPLPEGYPVIELRFSSPEMGEEVAAMGAPRGFSGTLSTGVVSHPSRVVDGVEYIQHTAPVSPGSSGGPLLDLAGRAVGIIVAFIEGAQNINLAVPAKYIEPLLVYDMGLTLADYAAREEAPSSFTGLAPSPGSVGEILFPIVRTWSTRFGSIDLSSLLSFLSDDGEVLLIGMTIDSANYLNWILAWTGGEEGSLRLWMELIGDLAASIWKGKVVGRLFYKDVYSFYPSGFPPQDISLLPDGRWQVLHSVATFWNYGSGTQVEWR